MHFESKNTELQKKKKKKDLKKKEKELILGCLNQLSNGTSSNLRKYEVSVLGR